MNLSRYAEREQEQLQNFGVRDDQGEDALMEMYGTLYKRTFGWVPPKSKLIDGIVFLCRAARRCDDAGYDLEDYVSAQMLSYRSRRSKWSPRIRRVATFRPSMLVGDKADRCYLAHLRLKRDRRSSDLTHLSVDFAFLRICRLNEAAIAETILGACKSRRPIAYVAALAASGVSPEYVSIVRDFDRGGYAAESVQFRTIRAARAGAIRHAFYRLDPGLPDRTQVDPAIEPLWHHFIPILAAAVAVASMPCRKARDDATAKRGKTVRTGNPFCCVANTSRSKRKIVLDIYSSRRTMPSLNLYGVPTRYAQDDVTNPSTRCPAREWRAVRPTDKPRHGPTDFSRIRRIALHAVG